MRILQDEREHSLTAVNNALATQFELSESERRELLPSGRQPVFRNRVGWARTYLHKAGLLEITKRAHFRITERGRSFLAEDPEQITAKSLERFDEFKSFRYSKKQKNKTSANTLTRDNTEEDKTPEETLEFAYQILKDQLAKEVLGTVKKGSPEFFERLVIDLLINMGYGGTHRDAGQAIGRSGDGGIDGIINEDKLGLDVIYIQAKRWDNTVPVKEIRDFTGALASKKARKGIFITTSSFPNSVYDFVRQVEYKIVLIDGEKLAELMIEYNVGLTPVNSYQIKAIDSDYFEE